MNKEVLEGNKLIAEFMGYSINVPDCYYFSGGPITGEVIRLGNVFAKTDTTKDMLPAFYKSPTNDKTLTRLTEDDYIVNPKYNTSWGLLMPVVKKISKLKEDGIIKRADLPYSADRVFNLYLMCPIELAWKAVVQFINFYNQTQKG